MKLKLLFSVLLGLNAVGCAHQSIKPSTQLNQQVYQGYEHLLGKQSYAFDGRISFNIQTKQAQSKVEMAKQQNLQPSVQDQQRQRILEQGLSNTSLLATQQRQWLAQDLANLENNSGTIKSNFSNRLQPFLSRFYYAYEGVVDLKYGQMSFNPKMGYQAANAEAWLTIPMGIDLRNDKFYVDVSAFSPLLTDPQYDGRSVVFDYKTILEKQGINRSSLFEVLKDFGLITAALADESDYQKVGLTAEDRRAGGVEKIRYKGEYAKLIAQYALYFHVNQNYLKGLFLNSSSKDMADPLGSMQLALQGQLTPVQLQKQLQNVASSGDAAQAATERLSQAIADLDETIAAAADIDEEYAYAAQATDAAAESADDASEDTVSDHTESLAQDAYANAEEMLAEQEKTAEEAKLSQQKGEILAKFDQYQRQDQLVSAQQLQKIVQKEQVSYQQLIALVQQEFSSIKLFLDQPYFSDITFDAQGRIVKNELTMSLTGFEETGIEKINATMVSHVHGYGQAKVNDKIFKNAVKLSEASNQNSVLNLGELLQKWTGEKTPNLASNDAKTLTLPQRYQMMAEQMLAQNADFIDAYVAVYRYAYILKAQDVLEEDFNIKSVDQTGRWNAIYYAKENQLKVSQKQIDEFDASPDDWPYYDEALSEEIWQAFETVVKQQRYQKIATQLKVQNLSQKDFFKQLYLEIEKQNEQQSGGVSEIEFPSEYLEFVDILAQIAVEDLKMQRVDQQQLSQLKSAQLKWFDAEMYEEIYRLMLKR